jgi:hypothetical protein
MPTAFFLIVLGVMSRLLPHPPNAVAMGAVALYAGARLPKRWAFLVPLAVMIASDALIDWGTGRPFASITRAAIYGTFLVTVAAGRLLRRPTGTPGRVGLGLGLSLGASTLFFLTTNFAVWIAPLVASSEHPMYPASLAGLMRCYAMALPFFGNTLLADLAGMAALFGLDRVASLWSDRRGLARPALAADA